MSTCREGHSWYNHIMCHARTEENLGGIDIWFLVWLNTLECNSLKQKNTYIQKALPINPERFLSHLKRSRMAFAQRAFCKSLLEPGIDPVLPQQERLNR